MKTLVLARFVIREALRKRIVMAAVVLSAVFLVLFAAGTHFAVSELETSRIIQPAFRPVVVSELLLSGIWVASLASALLAIFAASGTLSGEIESYTLHAIAAKPIRRWEIVLGKWLGLATMQVGYTAMLCTLIILVVRVRSGYVPPDALLGVSMLALQSLLLLSMTMLGSALFPALAAGIVVFMLHAIALAAGLEEQIGYVLHNDTMVRIGILVSLLVPSDAVGKLATSGLQTTVGATVALPGPFNVLVPPSGWMAAYAGLYLLACVAAAAARFEQQDL